MDKSSQQYFSGVDVTKNDQRFYQHRDDDQLAQSQFDSHLPMEYSIEREGENYDDLGIEFFHLLQQLYYEKHKVKRVQQPKVLFEFYKLIKKQQLQKMDSEKGRQRTKQDKLDFEEQKRRIQELMNADYSDLTPPQKVQVDKEKRERQLRDMIDYKEDSVEYTIKNYSEQQVKEQNQDKNISAFFKSGIEEFNESKIKQKNAHINPGDTGNRLFYSTSAAQKSIPYPVNLNDYDPQYRKILCQQIMHDFHFRDGKEEQESTDITFNNIRNPKYMKEHWTRIENQQELIQNALYQSYPEKIKYPSESDNKYDDQYLTEKQKQEREEKKKKLTDLQKYENQQNENLEKIKIDKYKNEVVFYDIDKYFEQVFHGFIVSYKGSCGYFPPVDEEEEDQADEEEIRNKSQSQVAADKQKKPKLQPKDKYKDYYKNLSHKEKSEETKKKKKDPIIEYYLKLNPRQKAHLDVEFEDDKNFEELLKHYYKKMKTEQKNDNEQREKAEREEHEKMKESIKKKVFRKGFEPKATSLEERKKPKDLYKTGQSMLELYTKFSKDRILGEMIVNEFKANRLSKFGLEYDMFDSDEEDMIKQRKTAEERLTPENVFQIFESRREEKVGGLQTIFKEKLAFYESEKGIELNKLAQKKEQLQKQDKQLVRHLNEAAKKFIEMRKNRKKTREQVQVGLNQYVSKTYHESKKLYPQAIHRSYRIEKYEMMRPKVSNNKLEEINEQQAYQKKKSNSNVETPTPYPKQPKDENKNKNKPLKWVPFPAQFKKDFFAIVRAYARTTVNKEKRKKLPFWAPPSFNLQLRTLNQKILKLSRDYVEEQFEKNKPETSIWDSKAYAKDREKILMKFEEAQNCTFNPAIGYRMSKRHRGIFLNSKINNANFLNKPRGFDEAVELMGENFKKKYPWLYKRGVVKKAWFLIQQGNFIEAYSSLCDNFHIKSIIQHFNPKQILFLQDSPDSMFNFEKIGKRELQEEKIRRENFENPQNTQLLEEVNQQIQYMEAYERDIIKKIKLFETRLNEDQRNQLTVYRQRKKYQQEQNKGQNNQSSVIQDEDDRHQKMIELARISNAKSEIQTSKTSSSQDPSLLKQKEPEHDSTSRYSAVTQSTYASRREQVKNIMCPLGNECPGFVGPRWHVSSVRACVPIGANCTFAHTVQELKFQKEIQAKKQMLFGYLKKAVDKGFQQPSLKAWNPAGNKLEYCLGCSQKNACYQCAFKEYNKQVILKLRNATKISNAKISQRQSFKQKQIDKKEATNNLTLKLGCLQKASIFYKLERYQEARDIISKAVEQVEKEVEIEEQKKENLKAKWKKSLKLNAYDGQEITQDTIYLAEMNAKEEGGVNLDFAKLQVYSMKTGLKGKPKSNSNELINYQIEEMYKKIELQLSRSGQSVDLMKKKIGELEELQELIEQRDTQAKSNPQAALENEDEGEEVVLDTQNMDKDEKEDKLREKRLKKSLRKIKTKMCPSVLSRTTCPRGKRCRLAHWANELLLVKPEKLIKNLRNAIDESEKHKLFQFWNPAGNDIVNCGGCGLCNFCRTQEVNAEIFEKFRHASKATNKKIRAKENFLTKIQAKNNKMAISDRKQRILMKAKILLGQGYHSKAYDMILKAVRLVDIKYKKDEELNHEIEEMYLDIQNHLNRQYQDLVYMNIQIDEQQKLLEHAEIIEPVDRKKTQETLKLQQQQQQPKTNNHYIENKESTIELAYRLYKQDHYEDASKILTDLSEEVEKEPDVEEDPFNVTLRRALQSLTVKKRRGGDTQIQSDEEQPHQADDNEDGLKQRKSDNMSHPLMRFANSKRDLYQKGMELLNDQEVEDEMMKEQNKHDCIYNLQLAFNTIALEKQDLKYNQEVNKKLKQAKDIVQKALNEKNKNFREKQSILESALKCIQAKSYSDGVDLIINAIAIIRKEKYRDQAHSALNKKIDSAYSVLKQGKYAQSMREKPVLTPVPEPYKEKQEQETRISAFRNLKHQRDRTMEEKNQQAGLEERVFKDPKTIGLVYPSSSIYQLKNAMYKIDQNIQHGTKYPPFVPTSTQKSKLLFGEEERLQRIGEKTLWQQNTILNTENKEGLEKNPFVSKDQP